jgi:hypothetical protein
MNLPSATTAASDAADAASAAADAANQAARLRETLASIPPGGMRCVMDAYVRRLPDGTFVIGGDGAALFSYLSLEDTAEAILWQAEVKRRE